MTFDNHTHLFKFATPFYRTTCTLPGAMHPAVPADAFGRCYATLPPAFLFYAFDRMFLFAYLYFRPRITAFLQQEEE